MATIELYTTGLHMEKNFVIDNITGFLNSANVTKVYTFLGFQYIRPEYEINIKIDAHQSLLNRTKNPDYLAVTEDNFVWYYYVNSVNQVSQKTLRFYCTMDVLNTYNGRYKLTKNSLIERQHVDRWKKLSSKDYTDRTEINVASIKSRTVEGLAPALYKTAERKLRPRDEFNQSLWYLSWWKNYTLEGQSFPAITLCASQDIVLEPGTSPEPQTVYLQNGDLEDYVNYYQTDGLFGYFDKDGTYHSLSLDEHYVIFYYNLGESPVAHVPGKVELRKKSDGSLVSTDGIRDVAWFGDKAAMVELKNIRKLYYSHEKPTTLAVIEQLEYILYEKSGTAKVLNSLANAQLTKGIIGETENLVQNIVECPYCPVVLTRGPNGNATAPPGWVYDNAKKLYVTSNLSPDLGAAVGNTFNVDPFRHNYIIAKSTLPSPLGPLVDIKTYNSETYKRSLVYDDNELSIPFETITDETGKETDVFGVAYTQSNQLTPGLLFKLVLPAGATNADTTNFDLMLLSNRNNEIPVYTSDYLYYMKNGYNYDKKRQQLGEQQSLFGMGMNALQGVTSGSSLGTVFGVASNAASFGFSHANSELTLKEKINNAKLRGYSTSAVNNLPLFKTYSGNNLIEMTFEPDEPTKEMINKYYSLYGYNQGYFISPNTDSRYAFNYVRGDVDIDGDDFKQPYFDAKDMIAEKYRGGVYFIHNRAATPTFWDLDLATANWETSVLPSSWI